MSVVKHTKYDSAYFKWAFWQFENGQFENVSELQKTLATVLRIWVPLQGQPVMVRRGQRTALTWQC